MSLRSPIPEPPADPDWEALEPLVLAHQASIWRYLRFLGCSPAEADELAQDTFVAVADRALHRFGRDSARAYLRRVARNALLKARRRERRRSTVELDPAEQAFDWFCRDDDGDRVLAALRECLQRLDDRARLGLRLRFVEQLDRAGIAARLGMTAHGAKSLLQRSYARLRRCIQWRLDHE